MGVLLSFVFLALLLVTASLIYWCSVSAKYTQPERADEIHTVTTPDLWKIRLFRYRPVRGRGEPVFLCHGMFGNRFNYTLPAGMSLVDTLIAKGYDCWVIDLRGTRSSTPPFGRSRTEVTMDGYLNADLPTAIDYVLQSTGYPKVHWVGHSMGGMLLYAYEEAFGNAQIASGVTLGSPPGFAGASFRVPGFLLQLLNLFPGTLNTVLRALTPLASKVSLMQKFAPTNWDNMNPSLGSGALFNMLDTMPPRVAEALSSAVQTNTLVLKKLDGTDVDVIGGLNALHTPLFAIYGAKDPFVAFGTAQRFFDELPGKDKKMMVLSEENGFVEDYSHVDLTFSRDGKAEVYEPIGDWITAHATSVQAPVEPKAAAKKAPAKRAPAKKAAAATVPAEKKPAAKKKAVASKKPAAKKKAAGAEPESPTVKSGAESIG
ncbi:MAG TPA: alpha/beta fold hydrolase [Candidatus Hydrogenedentes bacterium]|nr:alpha/beta fold hydrolase [Candidatus Hydrogenedentota bacterium]HPG66860.1 alpha/beta fold hydrolase [Candidatus Hydrogenedentota bacterium]